MKTFSIVASLLLLACGTQAQAAPSIGDFLEYDSAKRDFNCAYKGKKASKKCVVSKSVVNASIDSRTKQFYGANYPLPLLTIQWPDGDTSRYVFLDSGELYNLADKKSYTVRDWDLESPLSRGLYIDKNGQDHVRLW